MSEGRVGLGFWFFCWVLASLSSTGQMPGRLCIQLKDAANPDRSQGLAIEAWPSSSEHETEDNADMETCGRAQQLADAAGSYRACTASHRLDLGLAGGGVLPGRRAQVARALANHLKTTAESVASPVLPPLWPNSRLQPART